MKTIRNLCVIICLLLIIFFAGINFFLVHIELGQVGVRTKQYSILGEKGVAPRDFGTGWHLSLPLIHTWQVFDATVQTTDFTSSEQRQKENTRRQGLLSRLSNTATALSYRQSQAAGPEMIELTARDANTVRLDVTIKYRIKRGQAYNLYQEFNTESKYKSIVRDQVQGTIRGVLGGIDTEDFYHPEVRREKTTEVETVLKKELDARYIELIAILIRDISFDPSYEQKILQKKLADQDVELNKSKTLQEEKRGDTNTIKAKTQASVMVINEELQASLVTMKAETDKEIASIVAEAEFKKAEIEATADLYAAEKNAKGSLLEKEAEAQGETLRAAALSGKGGANYVALQAIDQLQLGEMRVSTENNDFLDFDSIIKKFGAEE